MKKILFLLVLIVGVFFVGCTSQETQIVQDDSSNDEVNL